MENQRKPHVLSADRLDDSIIITFDDGRCAMYSSALLYATLQQAEELYDPEAEDQAAAEMSEG